MTKERETEALKEAMKELKVKKAIIITEDETWESKFKGGVIRAVPAYAWMLGEKGAGANALL